MNFCSLTSSPPMQKEMGDLEGERCATSFRPFKKITFWRSVPFCNQSASAIFKQSFLTKLYSSFNLSLYKLNPCICILYFILVIMPALAPQEKDKAADLSAYRDQRFSVSLHLCQKFIYIPFHFPGIFERTRTFVEELHHALCWKFIVLYNGRTSIWIISTRRWCSSSHYGNW